MVPDIKTMFGYMNQRFEWVEGYITLAGNTIVTSKITLNGKITRERAPEKAPAGRRRGRHNLAKFKGME